MDAFRVATAEDHRRPATTPRPCGVASVDGLVPAIATNPVSYPASISR
jgi:hypothetical protein